MSGQPALFKRASHSNLGTEWESELDAVHGLYRRLGKADIVQNPSAWSFTTEKQLESGMLKYGAAMFARTLNGRPMMRERSDVDFSGGGTNFSICFDAKSSSLPNFPLANIAAHQIQRLRESRRCGCIAGFMIKMEAFDRVFFVPVDYADQRYIKWSIKTGRRAKPGVASLSVADLETNGLEILKSKTTALWDWMPVLVNSHG